MEYIVIERKMLIAYASSVRARFEDSANFPDDASQAPLFPKMDTTKINRPNFLHHTTPAEIGHIFGILNHCLQKLYDHTPQIPKGSSQAINLP